MEVFKIPIFKKSINLDNGRRDQNDRYLSAGHNFKIDDSGDFNSEDMMLMIDFQGIQDRIGDPRSTLIHGYITFRVIIEDNAGDNTFLNQQLTTIRPRKNRCFAVIWSMKIRYIRLLLRLDKKLKLKNETYYLLISFHIFMKYFW